MIRPTLRICVFAATIAASLSLSHQAQADERKPFFSRLNPRTWFQKKDSQAAEEDAARAAEQRPGAESSSTRAYLKDDPFGAIPGTGGATMPVVTPKVVAKSPINRDPVPVAQPSANRPVARTPQAPDNRSGSVRITDQEAASERESVPVASQSPRKSKARPSGNDFVDDFDKDYAKIVATTRRDSLPDSDEELSLPTKSSSVAKTAAKPAPESRAVTKTDARPSAAARNSELPSLPELPDDESVNEAPRAVAKTSSNARRQAALDELARAARGETNLPDDADDSFSAPAPKAGVERSVANRQPAQKPTVQQFEPDAEEIETRPAPKSYTDRKSVARTEQRPLPRTETLNAQRGSSSGLQLLAPDTLNSLIVSNELVPERRHYTGSQSYRASNVMSPESADELPVVISGSPSNRSPRSQASFASSNEPIARVSSNKASTRSLPDHSKFQQMSFDETDAESRLPLLSIGAGSKPAAAESGPLFLLPDVSKGSNGEASDSQKAAKESAPAFDFSDQTAKPESKKAPWGTLFTILGLIAVGCGVGVRLRKKGQLATAGHSGAQAAGENVG